ncbi:hypothetical protein C7S18_12270 [Ahniella affigens]|uniref:Carboxypeptidase regulatory-like domain-containing protein n=1 Tax=Ahniella affigens TaxID=2021234 RepID=A0A2P1PSU8_9GAMM|nr:carboxypeptidase-like regulatory domain-containing protein [Ahniella affigens]AVP97927.1 hypothetical protein C7S18_12270 [Ahniella affigens]
MESSWKAVAFFFAVIALVIVASIYSFTAEFPELSQGTGAEAAISESDDTVFSREQHAAYFEPGVATLYGAAGRDEAVGCSDDIVTLVPATPFYRKVVFDVLAGTDVPMSSAARQLGRYTQCNADGLFRFDGLPPARYLVVAFVGQTPEIMIKEVDVPADTAQVGVKLTRADLISVNVPGAAP